MRNSGRNGNGNGCGCGMGRGRGAGLGLRDGSCRSGAGRMGAGQNRRSGMPRQQQQNAVNGGRDLQLVEEK